MGPRPVGGLQGLSASGQALISSRRCPAIHLRRGSGRPRGTTDIDAFSVQHGSKRCPHTSSMPLLAPTRFFLAMIAAGVSSAACGPASMTGQRAPRHYSQTVDSATTACLRTAACYSPPAGETAILPWVSRVASAAKSGSTVLRLLEAAELSKIEQVLNDCANQASHHVNEQLLGKGQRPSRQRCLETFRREPGGNKVTWAMHLGREKHRAALECAQKELGELFPGNLSFQPTYRYDRTSKKIELIDPKQVDEWLRNGSFGKLLGALIPDVVIHAAGDLSRVQAVFDFKFPCPGDRSPTWREYHEDHPYYPANQGEIYREAFKVTPKMLSPGFGGVR